MVVTATEGAELGLVGAESRAREGTRSLEKKGDNRGIVVESGTWSEISLCLCLCLCFGFGVALLGFGIVGGGERVADAAGVLQCCSFSGWCGR